ncbi:hypothetical protein [Streptomyces sp. V3I7]|uniref:hypothetical protein n=1 Tax=Streptomyces sp. V3I7 TaxID=3042278 RepID=UPI00278575E0|nr:hypothetical protein [Streptomyces sp. V3I7]MDQ0993399.1 hypothetical protein [Streptomyces sp. V3I7]
MSQPQFQPPPHNPYNPYLQPAPPQQQPGFGQPPVPQQQPIPTGVPTAPAQPPSYPGTPPPVHAQPPVQAGAMPPAPPQPLAFPGPGPMPAPAQPPMYPPHPAPAYQVSPMGQPASGDGQPVGAVLLGLLASVIVSLLYTGLILAVYKDLSSTSAYVLYIAHAFINGAVVGALAGQVGRSSGGARVGAAIIAPVGAFFGYTNAIPLIIADGRTPSAIQFMLESDPLLPAKAWWGSSAGSTVVSLIGLVVAAVAAWSIAYAIGNRNHQA